MRKLSYLLIAAAAFAFVACGNSGKDAKIAELEKEIAELKVQAQEMEAGAVENAKTETLKKIEELSKTVAEGDEATTKAIDKFKTELKQIGTAVQGQPKAKLDMTAAKECGECEKGNGECCEGKGECGECEEGKAECDKAKADCCEKEVKTADVAKDSKVKNEVKKGTPMKSIPVKK